MANETTYSIEIAGHILHNVNPEIADDDAKLRELLRALYPNEMDPTRFSIVREPDDDASAVLVRIVPVASTLALADADADGQTTQPRLIADMPVASGDATFDFAPRGTPANGGDGANTTPKGDVITSDDLAKRGVTHCEFHYEGQITPIKLDVAFDDVTIRLLFSTIYPEVKDAHFTRTIKDGALVVKAIKIGGPKSARAPRSRRGAQRRQRPHQPDDADDVDDGGDVGDAGKSYGNSDALSDDDLALAKLIAAPAAYNPMYALWFELDRLQQAGGIDLLALMLNQGPLEYALEAGEAERREMDRARQVLADATPSAYAGVPLGF